MPTAHFPSLSSAETIEVEFLKPLGGSVTLRLLVDSGFTGQSGFVLDAGRQDLAHAPVSTSQASGALQGIQNRVVVSCRVGRLSFQALAIAILADLTGLALPPETKGLVGLSFLRNFSRWGSERGANGTWQFFLEIP